jgi:hypothetical protein
MSLDRAFSQVRHARILLHSSLRRGERTLTHEQKRVFNHWIARCEETESALQEPGWADPPCINWHIEYASELNLLGHMASHAVMKQQPLSRDPVRE